MAKSVDPDGTPRSAASHLGLYCFLRPVCPNTYGKYGIVSGCRFLPFYTFSCQSKIRDFTLVPGSESKLIFQAQMGEF